MGINGSQGEKDRKIREHESREYDGQRKNI
jgi:hypothetical protein